MASSGANSKPPVDFGEVASALAKAVCDGDIVNFRLLFMPFSPARQSSTELFNMPKYEYLLPDDEMERRPEYRAALEKVNQPEVKGFVLKELEANRPPQLHADLLLMLADNAVRLAKYTSAAQAYELLRVRAKMQQLFLDEANKALEGGDIPRAVHGYVISTGLAYDYAAFPEPLPGIPDFQTRALLLHADYPQTPEASIGMADSKVLLQAAFEYLLSVEAAAELTDRPEEVRVRFLGELVRQLDPGWDAFVARYREALQLLAKFADRMNQAAGTISLAEEIQRQFGEDPRNISATLLGRAIEDAEWWQYLKELAYEHPAAVLFVARQAVGDTEILVPRHRPESPVAQALGLSAHTAAADMR